MLREDLPEDSRHGRMYIALRERGDGERLSKLLARKVLNGQFYRSVAHKGARGAQGTGAQGTDMKSSSDSYVRPVRAG